MTSPRDAEALLAAGRFYEAAQVFSGADDPATAARAFEAELARMNRRRTPPDARRHVVRWASHFHVKAGNASRAAQLLEAAGEPQRAAQVLAAAGQAVAAAEIYLAAGLRQEAVETLVAAELYAQGAAICERAEEHLLAARLYERASDPGASSRSYERAHRWADAARTAVVDGAHARAGQMFTRAREHLNAGRSFLAAELPDEAIKSLALIRSRDEAYVPAVRAVVDALELKGDMSFAAERFLNEFLFRPLDDEAAGLVYRLAVVYEQGEFWETAQELLEKLRRHDSAYRDVDQRLRHVIARQRDSAAVYKQVLKEDFDYEEQTRRMAERRQRLAMPEGDLESFPDLDAEQGEPDPPPRPDRREVAPPDEADGAPRPPEAALTRTWSPGSSLVRLEPGTRLGERYELLDRLGAGGRGAVFKARDHELDELIAIKVIHPTEVTERSLAQFRSELKLARKLGHRNVVRLFDIGEVEGMRFITMEYIDGPDLERVIDDANGRLEIRHALGLLAQICAGLGAAHELGVIHRDIKPSNVMLLTDGTVRLLDFGIARLVDVDGMTRTGLAYGTPMYMSPEQIQGERDLDTRSDLYSLGVLMFNLFTGRLPFEKEEAFQLLLAHVSEPPPSPGFYRPDLPAAIETVILRLLEKSPDDRYATCDEVRRALAQAGS
jgi:tetratricopeptide (TPR) repeat protein